MGNRFHSRNPGARSHGKSCKGKKRYPTREYALGVRRYRISRGAWAGTLHVYVCRFCESWHVGNRTGSSQSK
ncbi:hypothetical protein GCM10010123_42590 [Pilimelia anulata]|uniref:Uncharacterized protein n=1 Tax=Pilimelia anulata TaxID=53371 RepID=A0A8J3FG77_9ACTN|nr:hypothetical protein [Pilimelia anulata]GGK08110.1 hypothetical protein GCM10010123_42590 [Pilimelia anulata]